MVVVIGVDGSGRTHHLHAVTRSAGSARHAVPDADTLAELLARTGSETGPVLVDDAHHYPPDLLRRLTAAARAGTPVALSRRPGITDPALAELDGLAARDGVVQCDPLRPDDVARLVAERTGARPGAADAAALVADTCGLPALVVALADGDGPVPAALRGRVQRVLARQPGTVAVARVLAVTHDLGPFPHAGLAEAVGLAPGAMAAELRALRESGLLAPGGERLVPAVARAVAADLTPSERQDLDRALSGVAAVRDRTVLHDAVALARSGRTARAARELEGAGATGRLLAVPLLAATGTVAAAGPDAGQADEAAPALPGEGLHGPLAGNPHLERLALRMAEAGGLLAEPARALPLLIEAAEELDRSSAEPPLPDTPHAIGALVASAVGDLATGRRLLDDALSAGSGGPGHARRHRLLAGWVALRGGRYPEARATSAPGGLPGDTANDGRDVLLSVCLRAGLARRSGDVAAARAAWSDAEHLLAREAVDLLHAECVEELVVAAARAGSAERADGVRATLREYAVVLGSATWTALLAWTDLHVAVVGDDVASAEAAAVELAELAELRDAPGGIPAAHAPTRPPARLAAQAAAARCWADALAGRVDGDDVVSAADALQAAGLPWEASRLAGQAGVRTPDSALARRLLERAREFRQGSGPSDARSVLSEREIEVGRLVLAGRTHREIGAQLFVSPKTVEHHVARMRTRLGVSTRAEFLAALREDLGDAQPGTIPP
ncbi:helix-turn-helix domain-containing protein [Myceligenerans xiligouense]|uniref:Regulatory LuxR family protein n=1 Tax=Myceligenerans xiligouense TaxID=253184 RepID=A0A3N4Z6P5_9MICO|nr:helix-turn-helix transcriptional regulator [Myceligenerans xiligouense]RPF20962.1 regulatory LuxR family protein [Myceligenerans xiligouense]